MAVAGNNFSLTSPQTVALRPLNKGMVTEGASALLPVGTFQKVRGFDVVPDGLRRLGGWEALYTGSAGLLFADGNADATRRLGERIEDFFVLTLIDGSTVAVVVSNRMLYTFEPSTGFTPVKWAVNDFTIDSYTKTGANGEVVVSGDITSYFTDVHNEWLCLDTDTTSTMYAISSVVFSTPNTTITLVGGPTAPITATKFSVYKPFQTPEEYWTDWAMGRNKAYLVDGITQTVFQFDGTYLSKMDIYDKTADTGSPSDPTLWVRTLYTARTITHYKDRLYFGNVTEPDGGTTIRPTQRIRWTDVLDWSESYASYYQDLAYKAGSVVAVRGSDTILLAFTSDAVYYGQQTSLVGIPYSFYELQTGNITTLGVKAIGTLLGGCIFVGRDDIYLIQMTDAGPAIDRIGSNVARQMLKGITNKHLTTVRIDTASSRVIVGVSKGGTLIDQLWFWNYKTKGWSYDDSIAFQALCGTNYVDQTTMDELQTAYPTATFDDFALRNLAMDSFNKEPTGIDLFGFDENSYLYQYNIDGTRNQMYLGGTLSDVAIAGTLETQDMDFDRPDDVKSFLEIGARLQYVDRATAFAVKAEYSLDRGRSWRSIGRLVFGATDDEDKLNFRATGSVVRFRFTFGVTADGTAAILEPWTLEELSLRARTRTDREAQRGTDR